MMVYILTVTDYIIGVYDTPDKAVAARKLHHGETHNPLHWYRIDHRVLNN